MTAADHVWHNCRLATLAVGQPGIGVIMDGMIAEKNGFTNVSDLAKDGDGVWRGKAQKDGSLTCKIFPQIFLLTP